MMMMMEALWPTMTSSSASSLLSYLLLLLCKNLSINWRRHRRITRQGFAVWQGDQLVRLFKRSLVIYNYENMPNSIKIAKVGSKFCQAQSKTLQNFPGLLKFCQNGEISPNLVTLLSDDLWGVFHKAFEICKRCLPIRISPNITNRFLNILRKFCKFSSNGQKVLRNRLSGARKTKTTHQKHQTTLSKFFI